MDLAAAGVIVKTSLMTATVATALIAAPGVALGRLLARPKFPGKALLRTLVTLPMVLPPVAIGLWLLRLLHPDGTVAGLLRPLGLLPIVLTWKGAVIAAAVMSFPLVVFGAQQGFESVPPRLVAIARTFGANEREIFRRITLPLARRAILFGLVLAFARALGEFGATTLVAGNIPNETQTLAIAIYDRIHDFKDGEAGILAAVSTVIAFVAVALAETFLRRPVR